MTNNNSFLDTLILNSVQRKAVEYMDGAELVFAGAGTGKTRVLTAKIAYLIKEVGLYPSNIFAATFTNKAASEMKERVEDLAEISCEGLWIGTFHSLCVRILRKNAHLLGYGYTFSIYDQNDQLSLIKKILKENSVDEKVLSPKVLLNSISSFKNRCKPYESLINTEKSYYEKEVIKYYGEYQKRLKAASAMDFDDLITNTVYLFKKEQEVLDNYRKNFKYILVDEYQDTNHSQFLLIKLLSAKSNAVFVVGDDDQSIYSWRGAVIENILSFKNVFPNAKIFKLEQNYRSTKAILNFANEVISTNSVRAKKKLWTDTEGKDKVQLSCYRDDRQEAAKVVEKIKEQIAAGKKSGEIAILFRTNAQSRIFEEVLRREKVPYIVVGGLSFYDRKEIKDCIAYIRLLVNPKDDISCERILNVPARGIGAKSQEKLNKNAMDTGISILEAIISKKFDTITGKALKGLEEFRKLMLHLMAMFKNNATPVEILNEMLIESRYIDVLQNSDSEESRSRIENINELINAISEWEENNPDKNFTDFLEEISLVSDIDNWNEVDSAVNLMTLHTAKGLEFDTVYLVGLEDGLIPSKMNFDNNSAMEEECRLLYVGITRAMRRLECSYAEIRMRFGQIMPMNRSRFLGIVSKENYNFTDYTNMFDGNPFANKRTSNRNFTSARSNQGSSTFGIKKSVTKRIKSNPQGNIVFDEFSQEEVIYRMGQFVEHPTLGEGKITAISGFGNDMMLTILFNSGIRKKLIAKFAKIKML